MLVDTLCRLFNDTFETHHTRLCGGFNEPFYCAGPPHEIRFTADYPRSALHEVAHWCIAGPDRRLLDDYGYWYAADGRNAVQQAAFQTVEVRPQALEALFCQAVNLVFEPSLDNLQGQVEHSLSFAQAIDRQRDDWLASPESMPPRGRIFWHRLSSHFQ